MLSAIGLSMGDEEFYRRRQMVYSAPQLERHPDAGFWTNDGSSYEMTVKVFLPDDLLVLNSWQIGQTEKERTWSKDFATITDNQWSEVTWKTPCSGEFTVTITSTASKWGAWGSNNRSRMQMLYGKGWIDVPGHAEDGTPYEAKPTRSETVNIVRPIYGLRLRTPTWGSPSSKGTMTVRFRPQMDSHFVAEVFKNKNRQLFGSYTVDSDAEVFDLKWKVIQEMAVSGRFVSFETPDDVGFVVVKGHLTDANKNKNHYKPGLVIGSLESNEEEGKRRKWEHYGLGTLHLEVELVATEAFVSRACGAAELLRVFSNYDENGDGQISYTEMSKVLRAVGIDEAKSRKLFKAADLNNDGHMEYGEFLFWLMGGMGNPELANSKANSEAFAIRQSNR